MSTTTTSVNDNINSGKYKNNIQYPSRPNKPRTPAIFDKRAGDMTPQDIQNLHLAREAHLKALSQHDEEMAEFENLRKIYQVEEQRVETEFKKDCELETFGAATGNLVQQKKDKVWAKAWEHGHSDGYSSIWHWYQEFAEVASIF